MNGCMANLNRAIPSAPISIHYWPVSHTILKLPLHPFFGTPTLGVTYHNNFQHGIGIWKATGEPARHPDVPGDDCSSFTQTVPEVRMKTWPLELQTYIG